MQSNGARTTGQSCATRARRLKARQDDHVAMVAHMVGQMMQHAPTRSHATG